MSGSFTVDCLVESSGKVDLSDIDWTRCRGPEDEFLSLVDQRSLAGASLPAGASFSALFSSTLSFSSAFGSVLGASFE